MHSQGHTEGGEKIDGKSKGRWKSFRPTLLCVLFIPADLTFNRIWSEWEEWKGLYFGTLHCIGWSVEKKEETFGRRLWKLHCLALLSLHFIPSSEREKERKKEKDHAAILSVVKKERKKERKRGACRRVEREKHSTNHGHATILLAWKLPWPWPCLCSSFHIKVFLPCFLLAFFLSFLPSFLPSPPSYCITVCTERAEKICTIHLLLIWMEQGFELPFQSFYERNQWHITVKSRFNEWPPSAHFDSLNRDFT